jgi:hypothetical protein
LAIDTQFLSRNITGLGLHSQYSDLRHIPIISKIDTTCYYANVVIQPRENKKCWPVENSEEVREPNIRQPDNHAQPIQGINENTHLKPKAIALFLGFLSQVCLLY